MGSQSSTSSTASGSSDQVRSDIQTALRNEPTLTSANVSVNVTDDSIELNGSVPSAKDRDEAKRIAQSFAGNRRVVDNIKVAGAGSSDQSSTGNVGSSSTNSSTTGASGSSTTPNSSTPNTNSSNPETPSVPKK
jgi:hypothetical protein